MSPSPALALYRLAARLAGPLVPALLARRAGRGKEDPARLGERMGRASRARPAGGLVWIHAASVGESLSVLGLIGRLRAGRPDLALLLTTGTVTSARLMAERLPEGVIHQFAPVDARRAAEAFLDHWRPDLAVWVESELWPGLIGGAAARGARLALVNARMSARSAARWRLAPGLIRALLSRFDAVLAQDAGAALRLTRLGADPDRVRVTGSLKAGGAPPDAAAARAELAMALAGRPVWLAASTHPGEEDQVARAQRIAARAHPGLLCLLVPRHPERGAEIAASLRGQGFAVSRRGAGEAPGAGDEVHVLDTLGEMGAWMRLAPVTFLGGSLVELGGHNPHEPAALRSAILRGPHAANFAEAYAALAAAGGAREVGGAESLGRAVAGLLSDEAARHGMAEAARESLGDGAAALEAVMAALTPLLPAPRGA